ncbi:hypothetical protein PoB_003524400 [Plakobranchus ocellatus]|uniref:Uncharacterized protein n=1 Tax=Plakobranchus ocellatus TaxID=259542 RepID=A0AAV4AQY8_9GAST|nr:hypothetical protein PoB_003524400 [Plakobranchus ocellatus]
MPIINQSSVSKTREVNPHKANASFAVRCDPHGVRDRSRESNRKGPVKVTVAHQHTFLTTQLFLNGRAALTSAAQSPGPVFLKKTWANTSRGPIRFAEIRAHG